VATLKKYDLAGNEVGEVLISDSFVDVKASDQMVFNYIKALRANRRQWSASTKTRGEINHSNQKPHRQKGTGNARQGTFSAPHYKGGGVVNGPKPKFNQHVHVNKKEKKAVVNFLLAEKIKKNNVYVLENVVLDSIRTKVIADFLSSLQLKKKVLFLCENFCNNENESQETEFCCKTHFCLKKSLNNIKGVSLSLAYNVNGYDLMVAQDIVILENAVKELEGRFAK
jgi:large subunit ribosomal protein L4